MRKISEQSFLVVSRSVWWLGMSNTGKTLLPDVDKPPAGLQWAAHPGSVLFIKGPQEHRNHTSKKRVQKKKRVQREFPAGPVGSSTFTAVTRA